MTTHANTCGAATTWVVSANMSFVTCFVLFRNSQLSTLYNAVKSRTKMTIVTTVRYQGITDRYLECEQGTVLNITGSYKHEQLIQQLMRSLEIRVKNTQTIKTNRKL